MNGEVIIGAEQDLPGCVNAPVLLQEVVRACSEGDRLKQPVLTLLSILAEYSQTAVELDDHAMRLFALRMGLFRMNNDDLKKSLDYEAKKVKAMIAEIDQEKPTEEQGAGNGK